MSGATAPPASSPPVADGPPPAAPQPRPAGGLPLARIVSGVVLAAGALAVIVAGPPTFAIAVALAAVLLAREWARLSVPPAGRAAFACLAAALVAAIGIAALGRPALGMLLVPAAAAALWFGFGRRLPLALGAAYLGLPCLALVWLRQAEGGGVLVVLWLFVVVSASDIGAYACGRLIGGARLAPRISPNKTWAGGIGGLIAAVACGAALMAGQGLAPWPQAMAASALVGLLAQGGDLLELWIKRRFGVKDSGGLIPGHGGLLDRVDSSMIASVGTALYVILSGGFATP